MSLKGKCLCGEVHYQLTVSPSDLAYCHCSECRQALGAAFGSYARIKPGSFSWLRGAELVTSFESGPSVHRCFCSLCGSSLGVVVGDGKRLDWITLSSIDDEPGIRAEAHIFVGSKASWYAITDDLPQFEEWPPESSEFHGRFS